MLPQAVYCSNCFGFIKTQFVSSEKAKKEAWDKHDDLEQCVFTLHTRIIDLETKLWAYL